MLKQRIQTALVALVVLASVMFFAPVAAARALIALLILAGSWEWAAFIFPRSQILRLVYVAFIAILMALLLFNLQHPDLLTNVFKVALLWWLAALVWMLFFPTSIPAFVAWICGALVLTPAWAALDHLYLQSPELLLFVLLIVWIADMGAYFVGKGFGRVKLAPRISPGKTWEGVFGGLTAVLLLATAGSRFLDAEVSVLVPFCIAVAMLSIVGDLTVSMFKRAAGVKDSGKLFPGHGGALDRIDSVTAAAPLFALGLNWIGLP